MPSGLFHGGIDNITHFMENVNILKLKNTMHAIENGQRFIVVITLLLIGIVQVCLCAPLDAKTKPCGVSLENMYL